MQLIVSVFHESSLRRALHSYFEYYHRSRIHLSWARTHGSRERFSRQKRGQSWQCCRSVGCTTGTSDGLPERVQIHHATRRPLDPCNLRPNRLSRRRIHQFKDSSRAVCWLSLRCIRGHNIRHGPYGIWDTIFKRLMSRTLRVSSRGQRHTPSLPWCTHR